MRFVRLELRAFGAYSDYVLDLSGGGEGLHVVYGPNEAGKTTALNGIRRLLYGFPHQSDYDFLHKSTDLRIGALLRRKDGDELSVIRRKGRKNTLQDESGNPLDDAVLEPYLRGIDEDLFAALFGIGYDSLVSGGRDILAAEGDIGSSVFAASAGIAGVQGVLTDLRAEADALFTPRAQNPPINRALRDYEQARKIVREKSMPERRWHELAEEIAELRAERDELDAERRKIGTDRSRLERIRRALQPVRDLMEARTALEAFGTAAEKLTQQREAVSRLYRGIEHYESARNDRPDREAERDEHRRNAERILRDTYPETPLDGIDALRLSMEQKRTIQRLAGEWKTITAEANRTRADLADIEERASGVADELKRLPDIRDADPLRRTVESIRREGDLEDRRDAIQHKRRSAESELEAALTSLGRWNGSPDDLSQTVNRNPDIDDWDERLRAARDAASRAREGTGSGDQSDSPVWAFVAVAAGLTGLAALAAMATGATDFLIALAVALVSFGVAGVAFYSHHSGQRIRRQTGNRTEDADRELREVEAGWTTAWSHINVEAGTPREMREWVGHRSEVLAQVESVRKLNAELSSAEETIERRKDEIRAALADLDEEAREVSLEALLSHAEVLAAEIDGDNRHRTEAESQHRALESEIEQAGHDREEAARATAAWRGAWTEAIAPLQIGEDTDPEYIAELVDRLKELFDELDEVRRIEDQRLKHIDKTIETFEANIELHRHLLGDTRDDDAVVIVTKLMQRIEEIDGLRAQIGAAEKALSAIADNTSTGDLIAQCEEADPDALATEITALAETENDLDERRKELGTRLAEKEVEQRQFDASAVAADAEADAQAILAEMRENVERYMRLRIAERVLRDEVERYRKENQGPVLERATEIFRTLTGGSFASLRPEYEDSDHPTLKGVRPGGETLTVEAMSEGTVDQLYLALRIGALERYLSANEPMPFIIDDVLIKFDDTRARAALEVFADLSDRTQVVYFTHHERIVELAEAVERERPGSVFIQRLGT